MELPYEYIADYKYATMWQYEQLQLHLQAQSQLRSITSSTMIRGILKVSIAPIGLFI